ncbi:MAG: GNAT family N-acetyltransferase [Spirochaetales bacterium]|nr:GNAT family N-acetyltransferase [Spirochaetales bacterium]
MMNNNNSRELYNRDFIFESDDFDKMCKFIIRDNSIKKHFFVWHIGRIVDWKYNLVNMKKYFPKNFSDNCHLWFNQQNEITGFILSEYFDNSFFAFVKDSWENLYAEIIDWYKIRWQNHYNTLVTQAVENQDYYISILEEKGFKRTKQMEITRVFDTALFKDYVIPDKSVSFQSMAENKNYSEQANLRLNAWPRNHGKELDQMIREYCRKSSLYDAKYDFVLVNDKRIHISGCEVFIDQDNNTGEIERVCTHSDYYNKGYAQMILKACMNRLYNDSIQTAYITGGNEKTIHLYGKLGHTNEVKRYNYELHY